MTSCLVAASQWIVRREAEPFDRCILHSWATAGGGIAVAEPCIMHNARGPKNAKPMDASALDGISGGWSIPLRWLTPGANRTLDQIDNGSLQVDPASRLGAYEATRGYPEGTVGYAVHNSIGDIYRTLGTAGEEKIGNVFHSPEARALYGQSVDSDASRQIADIEYNYWNDVRAENPFSLGGNLGSAVPPAARDYIQRNIEGGTPSEMPQASIDPDSLPHDPNLPDTTPTDLYGMNSALGDHGDASTQAPLEDTSMQNYDTPSYDAPSYEATPSYENYDAGQSTESYEDAGTSSGGDAEFA